jgi:hypothetical protein
MKASVKWVEDDDGSDDSSSDDHDDDSLVVNTSAEHVLSYSDDDQADAADDDDADDDERWKGHRAPRTALPLPPGVGPASFRGWTAPKGNDRQELAIMVAVTVLGLVGLLFGGFGLWSLSHPFGVHTDMSEVSQLLNLAVPDALSEALKATYLQAKVGYETGST